MTLLKGVIVKTLASCIVAPPNKERVLGRHADINTTLIYAHNINRLVNAPERKIDAVLSDKIETAYESSF